MSADAERPRPAYGEYATPEQVARARGMSLEEYERHLAEIARPVPAPRPADAASAPSSSPAPVETASAPAGAPTAQSSAGQSAAVGVGAQPVATPDAAAAKTASPANRIATTTLLLFGLLSSLFSIPSLLALGDSVALAFSTQGIDAYTSFDTARILGVAGIVFQLLLWLLTLALSVSALRRGRVAWWIPLVSGILAVLVVSALWLAAILIDPAFARYADEISLGV